MSKIISVASGFQYSVNIAYDLENTEKLKKSGVFIVILVINSHPSKGLQNMSVDSLIVLIVKILYP